MASFAKLRRRREGSRRVGVEGKSWEKRRTFYLRMASNNGLRQGLRNFGSLIKIEKYIVWKGLLGAFRARGLILMSLNLEGCMISENCVTSTYIIHVYLTENTVLHRHEGQSVNALQGNDSCLL
jgi:hypothetical protein